MTLTLITLSHPPNSPPHFSLTTPHHLTTPPPHLTPQGEFDARHYRGMMDCFVKTVRHEGVSALFKGLWPNYVKVVPSIAIAFVTYE